jgi:uncharacterized protein YdhG (YjbR/CyaY superfamily)
MRSKPKSPSSPSVDGYIAGFTGAQAARLREMRRILKAAVPKAEEKISYQMPSYWLEGVLVYFGAWNTHIGFYPASAGMERFGEELAGYVQTKGSIHFPYDKPLPKDLIVRIARFRVEENLARAAAKRKAGPSKSARMKSAKVCPNGHPFTKTSDCPTCPVCEKEKRLPDPLLAGLSAPARRALESIGVGTAKQLARHTEKEILGLHGMGPASLPVMKAALKKAGLAFKKG